VHGARRFIHTLELTVLGCRSVRHKELRRLVQDLCLASVADNLLLDSLGVQSERVQLNE
jgi:hypothetical protein